MDRTWRFTVLAQALPEPLVALAEEVLDTTRVSVSTPPQVGMLMMRLRDPVANEVFNVGEILVTQARVEIDDVYGYAVRLGDHPVVALAAAVLDAAAEVGHGLAPRILALLGDIEANERLRRGEAWRSVTPTRVSFDEMG